MFQWDEITYYQCPNQQVTYQSQEYVRWYRHYKNGYMPCAGGLMSQPYKYIQAMEVVDIAVHEYEALVQKRLEEKRTQQNRRS